MARVYDSDGCYVDVKPPELAQLIKEVVKSVTKGARIAGKQSLYDIRDIVQSGIRDYTFGLNPLKQSTLAARLMGKTEGNTPSRPKFSGTAPLYASGQTLRGIKINDEMLTLGFDDDATISYTGGKMGRIAEDQEAGFTIKGVYTKKMLAYLHILFKKQFGPKARIFGEGRARVAVAYSRTVDPRPAWQRAAQRSIPRVTKNFETSIADELTKAGLI